MKRRKTLLAVLLSLVGSVLALVPPGRPAAYGFSAAQHELPACGTYCGTERWSVKTLSDADRDKVDFTARSEEHTSELQSRLHLVCRLLLEKKKKRQHDLLITDQLT